MTTELILDPQIRTWVFLPMVLIAIFVGVIRQHISTLIDGETQVDPDQIRDNNLILRARLLQRNSKQIPKSAFHMRRQAFNNPNNGYLMEKRTPKTQNLTLTDPRYMMDLLKGNSLNVFSMLLIGGWINWVFSGFLTTKVPFPVTLTFQSMLQRGIELNDLEASWVSSASWYFLNVFCLRSVYSVIFAESEANIGEGFAVADPAAAMKQEREALEIMEHKWALKNVFEELLNRN